ncbi:hypothetical protein [Mesorhizobium sp. M1348]|uniref:hypothetical protein n=1 Tax=unclassified Mesorhizobium TaxID=325217 RepID=UPI00333CB066
MKRTDHQPGEAALVFQRARAGGSDVDSLTEPVPDRNFCGSLPFGFASVSAAAISILKAIPLDTKPQSVEHDVEPVNETREQPTPVRESRERSAGPRQEKPDGNASQRKAGLLGFPRRHPYAAAAIALALLLVAAGVAIW